MIFPVQPRHVCKLVCQFSAVKCCGVDTFGAEPYTEDNPTRLCSILALGTHCGARPKTPKPQNPQTPNAQSLNSRTWLVVLQRHFFSWGVVGLNSAYMQLHGTRRRAGKTQIDSLILRKCKTDPCAVLLLPHRCQECPTQSHICVGQSCERSSRRGHLARLAKLHPKTSALYTLHFRRKIPPPLPRPPPKKKSKQNKNPSHPSSADSAASASVSFRL